MASGTSDCPAAWIPARGTCPQAWMLSGSACETVACSSRLSARTVALSAASDILLIRECQDATRSRISFHPEDSIETVCQLCYQPEPGRPPLDLLKVESVSPILHIESVLSPE